MKPVIQGPRYEYVVPNNGSATFRGIQMKKVGTVYIGNKYESQSLDDDWAVIHACKTSHQARLGYTKPLKDSPYYIMFRENNHLYLNWVDEPTGRYFQVETFIEALDFIDEYIQDKKIFIHCDLGQSRSPTLAMVYLAKRAGYLADEFNSALSQFQTEYPEYNPSGIINFIIQNWDDIK